MKRNLLFAAMLIMAVAMNAQQVLTGNRILTKEGATNLGLQLEKGASAIPLDVTKDELTFEVVDFGEQGCTYVLNVTANTLRSEIGDQADQSISCSGRNYQLMYMEQNGSKMYLVVNPRTNNVVMGASYIKQGDATVFMGSVMDGSKTVTGLTKGITTVEDLKKTMSGLASFNCKVVFARKSGNFDVYSVKIPDMKKNVWNGQKYVDKLVEKDYGEFYFDAQGKLAKWIIF